MLSTSASLFTRKPLPLAHPERPRCRARPAGPRKPPLITENGERLGGALAAAARDGRLENRDENRPSETASEGDSREYSLVTAASRTATIKVLDPIDSTLAQVRNRPRYRIVGSARTGPPEHGEASARLEQHGTRRRDGEETLHARCWPSTKPKPSSVVLERFRHLRKGPRLIRIQAFLLSQARGE